MHTPLRGPLAVFVAALLCLPPVGADAAGETAGAAGDKADGGKRKWIRGQAVAIPSKEQCARLPAAGPVPWQPGETLTYDVDVLGANAGKLRLIALKPVGKGSSAELPLRALAASNSFFSKLRKVRGRSTSYVRARDLHPRRYREDTNEGGVVKWADVVFKRPSEGGVAQIEWQRNKIKGKRNIRYGNEIFDPVSAAYYLRTLELKEGQPVCFDAYGIRQVWRVFGSVKGLEPVTVPAGSFQAWHIVGTAVRLDNARSHREIHLWISNDARKLMLASLGVIDLGPVRAQLSSISVSTGEESEESLAADRPGAGSKPAEDEDEDEEEDTAAKPPPSGRAPAPAAPTTSSPGTAAPTTGPAPASPAPVPGG